MMPMRTFLLFVLGMLLISLHAQVNISIPAAPHHVVAGRGDTIPVVVSNTDSAPVSVYGIATPFDGMSALSYTSILAAGATDTLWLVRSPGHNITYRFPIWVITDRAIAAVIHDYQGVYADSAYYKQTRNLWDNALKQKLKQIITANHVTLSYSAARDKMFMNIDNWRVNGRGSSSNKIECVYTGRTIQGYSSRYDAQNQGFNTEHTFPQSKFGGGNPMRSDLFHLFPTDAGANSARGNLPFGEVTTPTWSSGGSKKDYNHFEPRDAQKGPAARALFYFVVRYQDYSGFVAPQESLLRTWHKVFPPNAVEKRRNQDIYAIQHNRNPFIDHPEFVDRIYSITGSSTRPAQVALTVPADTLHVAEAVDTFTVPFWVTGGTVHVSSIDYDTSALWLAPPAGTIGHEQEGYIQLGLKNGSTGVPYPVTLHWGSNQTTRFYVQFTTGTPSGVRAAIGLQGCQGLRFRNDGVMVTQPIPWIRLYTVQGKELRRIRHPLPGHVIRYPAHHPLLIVRWKENHSVCAEKIVSPR